MNNSDKIEREINDSLANLGGNDVECMNTNTLEDSTSLGKVDNVIYQPVTVSAAPRPATQLDNWTTLLVPSACLTFRHFLLSP